MVRIETWTIVICYVCTPYTFPSCFGGSSKSAFGNSGTGGTRGSVLYRSNDGGTGCVGSTCSVGTDSGTGGTDSGRYNSDAEQPSYLGQFHS